MGFHTFASGEVLTAANVNTYLMNQAVIVCTSGTRPSSPSSGMTIYETDTGFYATYNGSSWTYADFGARGYVSEAQGTNPYTLTTTGTAVECVDTRIVVPTQTVARRYRVTISVPFNMASGTNGLYRAGVYDTTAGAIIGRYTQGYTNVTGGPGQIGAVAVATKLVAASTAQTFAASGTRVSGGSATDTAFNAYCLVEDIGPV